ncbi:MAG: GNAT family N-acetyltransferase [Candidatus Promineifilaceae bacterium]
MSVLTMTAENKRSGLQERPTLIVRPATSSDVPGIVRLVNIHARRGDLLPRSLESITAGLNNWLVAEEAGEILGCVSLLRYTSGLVEVRSLAVDDEAQGKGVGRQMMEALLIEAEQREIPTLFALTRAVGFFERCGFTVVEKDLFPEKVWSDCQFCPVRDRCDETAVVLIIKQ